MLPLPSVAIVILNWNGKKFLEKFLPSVLSSTYNNFTVVVADNASNDDSVIFLKTTYPQIKILSSDINNGFAKGYNIALAKLSADYFILLNSDVEVQPGWIEPVIELMESDKLIAACQPKVLRYTYKITFEYAGASGGWLDNFGYPFARGRIFDNCEIDAGQYNDVQEIFWASGAAFFVRAETFKQLGGFDEYFFAHQEEIDLCWRLQLTGYKVFVQPKSVVYHVGGGTLQKNSSRKTYLNFRNNLVMITKNLPPSQAWWKVPLRITLNKIFAMKALLSGDGKTFIAVLKAHIYYLHWLFFIRKNNFSTQDKNGKLQGLYKGLIIWQYFIKKKNTFSEIVETKNDF
ncbi:MAG: glycosyltransferase family 2 protein [Bacteroidota bacterium]|nr:glycosyltransferase family 2 protein [Bacteroidota bacterium]